MSNRPPLPPSLTPAWPTPSARWRWTRSSRPKSGHPGLPMGAADVATVLFTQFLKFDPADPDWADRDRFVLSAGHGSMLLYALLYLTGYSSVTHRRDQTLPPARLQDARASGKFHHHRHRDHHRPARPRHRQRGRHGDGREAHGGRVRQRYRQSQDLCAVLRRRPDGRYQPGSHRARRPSEIVQVDRAVRRQRHFHRRRAVAVGLHRPGEALRGIRLGRLARRRSRCASDCRSA